MFHRPKLAILALALLAAAATPAPAQRWTIGSSGHRGATIPGVQRNVRRHAAPRRDLATLWRERADVGARLDTLGIELAAARVKERRLLARERGQLGEIAALEAKLARIAVADDRGRLRARGRRHGPARRHAARTRRYALRAERRRLEATLAAVRADRASTAAQLERTVKRIVLIERQRARLGAECAAIDAGIASAERRSRGRRRGGRHVLPVLRRLIGSF